MTNLEQKGQVRPGARCHRQEGSAQPQALPAYRETQAISASVLNTICLVLLFWTTSPFTRQQIFKLCGSEMQKHFPVVFPAFSQPRLQVVT